MFRSFVVWTTLVLLFHGSTLSYAENFECPVRFGWFADKSSCTKYYVCNFGFGVRNECPNGLLYSTRLRNCDWPTNVNCTQYPGMAYREGEDVYILPEVTEPSTTPEVFMFPVANTRFPQIFAQTPQRTSTSKPKLQVCAAPPCSASTCPAPSCRCGSADIPNGLDPDETPQMIVITFENAITDITMSVYEGLFLDARKNPNGCPIRASFFVSHEWTDYSFVQTLYSKGHEIDVLGVSLKYNANQTMDEWAQETQGQRKIISKFSNISTANIRGMRAPYLTIGGDDQFTMLYDNEFLFDSSMPVFENEYPFYPFTMDCRINNYCMIDPCPNNSYPGIWEIPIVMWNDLSGTRCTTVESCTDARTGQEVYELLMSNFERHYITNKAPFNMFLSASWFTDEKNTKAFKKFLEEAAKMKDVYFVTINQVIQWMKNPTPLSQIKNFKPWQCTDAPKVPPCDKPNICTPWFDKTKEIRPFKTCMPCPKNYPWLGNEDGH